MTDEEVQRLLVLWLSSRGSVNSEDQLDGMIAILEERCPPPDACTLVQAMTALELT